MTWLARLFHQPKVTYNRAMPEGYLTTKEAAERLQLSEERVLALIKSGKLKAEKFGWAWAIRQDDFATFEATRNRKAGRPPKAKKGIDNY